MYLAVSPYYDCPPSAAVLVIGVSVDGLDPDRIIEVIEGAPAMLEAVGIDGTPRLHTLLDVS